MLENVVVVVSSRCVLCVLGGWHASAGVYSFIVLSYCCAADCV